MRKNNGKGILFIIFLLLGILIPIQVKGIIAEKNRKSKSSYDLEELVAEVNQVRTQNESLISDIDNALKEKEELTLSAINKQSDSELENLYNELQSAKIKAGLTEVTGPGVIIKLDDAIVRQENADPNSLIIHDTDIKVILNDLKIAGAQAISINGERIVSMSEQICNGPTIKINKNRYAVPYVISVIGDPDMLNLALQTSERLAFMTRDRIVVNIRTSRSITIPALKMQESALDSLMTYMKVVDSNVE